MNFKKYKQVIDKDFSRDADFISIIIKKFNLNKNSKILDIGTGFGAMSILLALNGYYVLTGQPEKEKEFKHNEKHHFDQDEVCEHNHSFNWRENAKAVGIESKIKFQYLNAENLNFPDKSFDAIFMYDTLQHIRNRKIALSECLRVIRSSGLVCVIEWNKKAIKETKEKYGFTIDYIDPRGILNKESIATELFTGDLVNLFKITKI